MKRDFFTFEDLGGEYPALATDIRRGMPTAVFGVSDSLKYLIAGLVDAPVVYVTTDGAAAQKTARNIAALSGKRVEVLAAKDEVLLYRKALSKDALFRRLNGVYALQTGCDVVVAELDALLQLFPKTLPTITLKEGEEFDFSTLPAKLTEMGYTRSFEVETKGAFSLRGDILDIYPVNGNDPVRVDFFGDTVEKIKPYDIVTGERLRGVREITVLSATDVVATEEDKRNIALALERGVKKFTTSESYARAKEIADEIRSAETCDSSFVLPLLENTTDFFSVINENTVLVFD
ncbi:MAG: hypothetical protein J6K50_02565, partial [Clostridia bacterium]|nr:hypothetical protein [Clostridia bacterium]